DRAPQFNPRPPVDEGASRAIGTHPLGARALPLLSSVTGAIAPMPELHVADPILPEHLALQRLYHWERSAPDRICFTQPQGGGVLREFTWSQVMAEVRRIAAHLRERGVRDGAKV